MIQRIQTVYLLLVVAICMSMFFVPMYKVQVTANTPTGVLASHDFLYLDLNLQMNQGQEKYSASTSNYLMKGLDVLVLLLSIATIITFNTRKRQLMLSRILLVFSIIFTGFVWFCIISLRSSSVIGPDQDQHFLWGAWLPLLLPILAFLAGRGISHDIHLVKSADRLR